MRRIIAHLIRAINIKLKTKTLESNVLFQTLFVPPPDIQHLFKVLCLFLFCKLRFGCAFFLHCLFTFSFLVYFDFSLFIWSNIIVYVWQFVWIVRRVQKCSISLPIFTMKYFRSQTRSRFAPDNLLMWIHEYSVFKL